MKSNKIVLKDKISAIIYFLALACYRATLVGDTRKAWDPHIENVIKGNLEGLHAFTDATNSKTSPVLSLNKGKEAEWKSLMDVIVDKPDALTSSAVTKAQSLVTYKFGNNSYEQQVPFEFQVIEDDVAPATPPTAPPVATEQQPVPAATAPTPAATEGPSVEALEADVAKWTKKLEGAEDEDEKAMYSKKLEAAKAALAAATPATPAPVAGPSRAEQIKGMEKLHTLLAQNPVVKEALTELMILAEEDTQDGKIAMVILEEIEAAIDLTYTKPPKGVAA